MKEYEVTIDLGSRIFSVEAENVKEAKIKTLKLFEEVPDCDKIEEYWIGDVEEVENGNVM